MNNRLRNLLLLAVVVVIVAAVVASRLSKPATALAQTNGVTPDETSTVDRGDIAITVSATGPIQAEQNVGLTFPTTGTVSQIMVAEGDHVLKGQTIAVLDTQDLMDAVMLAQSGVLSQQIALRRLTDKPREIDVKEAEASLRLAQAQLYESQHSGADPTQVKISQMNLEIAKNQLWQTELQRDIDNKTKADLLKKPLTAPAAQNLPTDNQHQVGLDNSGYNVEIAQAQLGDAQSRTGDIAGIGSADASVTQAQTNLTDLLRGGTAEEVAQAQAQLEAAQAKLDAAKVNLSKATLVAPFDGVIAKLNIHVGEHTPQDDAVTMLDTHSFYVDIAVDEADISNVQLNQPATLTLDALPDATVNGKVTRIADTSEKKGDVVTYKVRVEIDPAGQTLLNSMSATTRIIVSQESGVLRVRNRFIRMDRTSGKAFLSVLQADGTYKDVEVTLGLRSDTYTEIKSGVNEGDKIAILPDQGGLISN